MKLQLVCIGMMLSAAICSGQAPQPELSPDGSALLKVKRIYVADLAGGTQAAGLRELIIASLSSTKLFILTDNVERADAVLKGAADDHSFTDMHSFHEGSSAREASTSGSRYSATGIISTVSGIAENESHESKERKHEAYATVRLCNKDGDVLWSTTQESLGAKFRGASADVAAKIAHQMLLDYERARRKEEPASPPPAPAPKQ